MAFDVSFGVGLAAVICAVYSRMLASEIADDSAFRFDGIDTPQHLHFLRMHYKHSRRRVMKKSNTIHMNPDIWHRTHEGVSFIKPYACSGTAHKVLTETARLLKNVRNVFKRTTTRVNMEVELSHGFAFSQEEHGAVTQSEVIRAYNTNLPKPGGM